MADHFMENMQQPNIDLPDQGSNVSQQISQENGTDQSFSQTHNSSVEVIVQHPRAEVKPPIKQLVPLINNEAEHLVKKGSNEQQDQIVTSIISQFCSVLKTKIQSRVQPTGEQIVTTFSIIIPGMLEISLPTDIMKKITAWLASILKEQIANSATATGQAEPVKTINHQKITKNYY
jgi:hypothetical protein